MSIANTSLEVIASSATAAFGAQLIKFCTSYLRARHLDFRTLVDTGGMPSSHSALVSGIATSVGLISGFQSIVFAVALGFAAVVMYDAAGLRRSAGKMAGILNRITEDIYMDRQGQVPDRLRELLGHTPIEVIAGALMGLAISYLFHYKLTGGM